MGVPEGEERAKDQELFENMSKIFQPGAGKRHTSPGNTESQTRWTQRGPHEIKMVKFKDKENLKSLQRKAVCYQKGALIRLSSHF